MIFRSFTPLVVDVIATIFLSVVTVKNLQKFLKDMQQKEAGIQAVARSEIAVDMAFNQASIDRENAAMQQERTRMDNELLRELTRKRNNDTLGGDSGSKGKYGGGW
jgi:Lhr-like helicase